MARKLGLGWGTICCATILLAGCQTTSGNRFAHKDTPTKNQAIAKQTMPQPNFPMNNPPSGNGFNTAAQNGAFPTANSSNNFPPPSGGFASQGQVNQVGNMNNVPQMSPSGPQGLGTPTTANRNITVNTTALPPQQPPQQTNFADPGFQQMPPLPPSR